MPRETRDPLPSAAASGHRAPAADGPLLGGIREVTQTLLYSPQAEARGILGNCLQAAIASALGLELDAVPHLSTFLWWDAAARLWLRGRRLDWQRTAGIPPGRCIIIGPTARGTGDHAVVGDNGVIAWDPHPSRAGLTSVKCAYLFVKWPADEPSACVCCGSQGSST